MEDLQSPAFPLRHSADSDFRHHRNSNVYTGNICPRQEKNVKNFNLGFFKEFARIQTTIKREYKFMDYASARKAMIDGQLTPNKVIDKDVLSSINQVPRECFVDTMHKQSAYNDGYAPLATERSIMPPLACARLIQSLEPQYSDKVLVVAAGSGYSAAVLANIVGEVHAVEDKMNLFEMAKRSLLDAKCRKVKFYEGKPELGHDTCAPYDKILIDVPVEFVPDALWDQLKEGGKLAALCCENAGICVGTVFTKKDDVEEEKLFEAGGEASDNFKKPQKFTF